MNSKNATKQDLKDLEGRIQQGFNRTIEDLSRMIKAGFDQVTGQFGHVDNEFAGVRKELGQLQIDVSDIKLRLDQAAYRFELVELERRVDVLEKHTGLQKN